MANLRLGGAENVEPAGREALEALSRDVDHYDPLFLGNRVEMFRVLHSQGQPIRWSSHHGGFWFVTGYGECAEVQRRMNDFSNKDKVVPRRPVPDLIPSGLDNPRHKSVKTAMARMFTPTAVTELNGKLAQTCERLFEPLHAAGSFDVVKDLMLPLMGEFTLVHMLGLDPAKAMGYAMTIHNQSRPVQDPDYAARVKAEGEALTAELLGIIERRDYDQGSMFARIAETEIDGTTLTPAELVKVAYNLTIGGFGTTAAFAGSCFVFLGRNRDYRQQIIEDPSIIPHAINELLRLFTPTQTFARRVEHDTELCGQPIRAGEQLLMGYGAANFDPKQFENPEQVDFLRKPSLHMGFGTGPHRCLGEHVTRAVIGKMLSILVERIPDYELIEDAVEPHGLNSSMFGYGGVPVRF